MADLDGARVVITGGSTGIGRATAQALAARGSRLVLAARRTDRLDATIKDLQAGGADAIGVPTDIAVLDQVDALAKTAWEHLGGVDICLFNAGSASGGSLLDPDMDVWREAFDTNVFGLLHCIKAFVPRLVEQGAPAAVYATTSGAGIHGTTYRSAPYAAAKTAELTIMESLYGHLRDAQIPINVGVIVPPLTRTNLAGDDLSVWDLIETSLAKNGSRAPIVDPEEFADVIVEGLQRPGFWIEATLDQDERFFDGRCARAIRASRRMIQRKAQAVADHLPPDDYLW